MNRGRIAEEMARFEKHLGEIRDALGRADRVALERALAESRDILEDLDR